MNRLQCFGVTGFPSECWVCVLCDGHCPVLRPSGRPHLSRMEKWMGMGPVVEMEAQTHSGEPLLSTARVQGTRDWADFPS